MENQPSATAPPRRAGFLDRTLTLRWALILIGLAVAAGLIAWALQAIDCGRIVGNYQTTLREATAQSAENTARAIAVVGNRDIARRRYESLQEASDNLVRSRPLTFIAIVDGTGRAVVHTNRSMLRKQWKAPAEKPNEVVAWVPVMDFTEEVAKVYVGARVRKP